MAYSITNLLSPTYGTQPASSPSASTYDWSQLPQSNGPSITNPGGSYDWSSMPTNSGPSMTDLSGGQSGTWDMTGVTPGSGSKQVQTPTSGNWGGDWNTGGELSGPGTGEQWYSDHGSSFDQPTNSQNYWNAVQGSVLGGPNETNWTEQMLGTMPSSTSAVSGLDSLGRPMSYGMNTNFGPTSASSLSTTFGPTAASGLASSWGPSSASKLDTSLAPRAADDLSMYFGPTAASKLSTQLGNGYSSNAYGQSSGELAGPTMAETGAANGAFVRDSSYSLPELRGKSYMEMLADDPQMGFDQYYDRSQEVAQEALDKQHAARGIWNSGAAADEDRQMLADLNAKRALDKTNWIQSTFAGADTSKSRRLGQEMDLNAGMASDKLNSAQLDLNALLGRVGARTSAASAADAARLGLLGEESKRSGLQDEAAMAQAAEQSKRAGLKDSDLIAALGEQRARAGLQDQSAQADRQEQRLRAGLTDQDAMAQAAESRLRAGLQDSDLMAQLQEQRQRLGQMDTLGLQYGQEDRQRAEDLDKYGLDYSNLGLNYGKAMDSNAVDWSQQGLNYLLGGNTIAGTTDAANRAQTQMGGDFAFKAQDALQGRDQAALDNLLGVSNAEGSTLGSTVENGSTSQRGWTEDEINALLGIASGGVNAANDKNAQSSTDVGMLIQLAGLLKGSGTKT